jgi:hypothetical protein
LPSEYFEKLCLIFLDMELNRNELEIDKWDMEIDKLMEYEYKDDPWITDIIKAI